MYFEWFACLWINVHILAYIQILTYSSFIFSAKLIFPGSILSMKLTDIYHKVLLKIKATIYLLSAITKGVFQGVH